MTIPVKLYPAKPKKLYLYGTCLINHFSPDSGIDAITILEQQGIDVIYPENQTCCGQPAYNSGYTEQAREVATKQMLCFPEDIPIVILSGSCGGMMKKHYPSLFNHSKESEAFASRIYEFSEFLLHVLNIKLDDKGEPKKVTLHTSCAGRREMGIHESGVQLLKKLEQVEYVTHEYENDCCGFGGTFCLKHPEISTAMVEDKTNYITESHASEFVSTDWGCMLNINGSFEYQHSPIRGKHLASFIRERTLPKGDEQ